MKYFAKLVMLLLAFQVLAEPLPSGLPRPWPFPWAETCPMIWNELEGDYQMIGSKDADQIMVRVSTSQDSNLRTVRLVWKNFAGGIRQIGLAMVFVTENEVKVHMIPVTNAEKPIWVTLRMHYRSDKSQNCDLRSLVPILTVTPESSSSPDDHEDYLLTKSK